MREASSAIWTYCKYFIFIYTILSLIFTANHFYTTSHSRTHQEDDAGLYPRADQELLANTPDYSSYEQVSPQVKIESIHQGTATDMISEPSLMSKLFSDTMGPSSLKPYYFKATHIIDHKDITLSTLVTRNRFPVLGRLASHYQGPISAAIHINEDDTKDQVLKELNLLFENNPDMRKYVDIHSIVDVYDRQFNYWRNVAKLYARTDYLMMLDVDFYLCTDFRHRIINDKRILSMLDSGRTALVVPAFEHVVQDDGLDATTFPTHKDALVDQVLDQRKLDMFHKSWLNGHGATNYSKWYSSSDIYKVTDYNYSYEPYVIFKKEGSPWCDERFIGYGANKAACLFEIYLSGMEYWVLPDDFLIHQTHAYPEDTRRKERQYNRKLYSNFREELCLRYSRKFVANGEWETLKSENLKKECQKIRGFRLAV